MLLPENSTSSISNFSILLGVKTFYLNNDNIDVNTFSWRRFGANAEFKINNNLWSNDTLSASVTINTLNINLNYLILNAEILNTKQRVKLILSCGLTTRRLGGNFGLESNKIARNAFLGTEKRGFNGFNYGVRLEVSKLYGEMNLSNFA